MPKSLFVLLIHEISSDIETIRQALFELEGFHLQCVTRLPTALARIAGGGVDAILIDLSGSERMDGERLESVLKLQSAAPHLPIVVIGDAATHALLSATTQVCAPAFLTKEQCKSDLKSLLWKLTEHHGVSGAQAVESRKAGAIIAVLGSKGGVGATTVALNVACSLAQAERVILAELRPARGTLALYFNLHNRVQDLTLLLRCEPDAIGESEIEACLWPYKDMPRLRILFGPQGAGHYLPIDIGHAKAIVQGLAALADHVVIDLPSMPSDANRAIIQASECLALVTERDPLCLESARMMLQTLTSWGSVPRSMGTVIVNRALLAAPVPIEEFETRLGVPILAVIPPAADDLIAAQRANRPLVAFDSDGLAASCLVALARLLCQSAAPLNIEPKLATV
jgi:pilus assembly protein CpaE